VSDFFERERAKLKERWTALLVLITCFGVTMLVVQQGGTIDRQRSLIQALWSDSKQLQLLRMKDVLTKRTETKPSTGNPAASTPPADSPAAKPHPRKAPTEQVLPEPAPAPHSAPRVDTKRVLWWT
jgi:cell division protein FtsN